MTNPKKLKDKCSLANEWQYDDITENYRECNHGILICRYDDVSEWLLDWARHYFIKLQKIQKKPTDWNAEKEIELRAKIDCIRDLLGMTDKDFLPLITKQNEP